MLRLAHRIALQGGVWMEGEIDPENEGTVKRFQNCVKEVARHAKSVIVDNVASFYWDSPREWNQWGPQDYPCCAPPFEVFILEWNNEQPELNKVLQFGWLFSATDAAQYIEKHPDNLGDDLSGVRSKARWAFDGIPMITDKQSGHVFAVGTIALFYFDANGGLIYSDNRYMPGISESAMMRGLAAMSLVHVPLLALSFMNCKNVAQVDATDTHGPSDKWLRRQRQPRIEYRVLDINPMKQVLRTEGGSDTNGLKKALHICRGHFAHYSEDRPLFGKFTGQFWKPAHVRGNIDQGAVVKDYRVKV